MPHDNVFSDQHEELAKSLSCSTMDGTVSCMAKSLAKPHGITVSELLHILDGAGLRLASGGGAIRLPRTSSTLFDPWAPPTGQRRGILLGIGMHPTAPESVDAVRKAARCGFGAIVVKSLSLGIENLAAVADAEAIALLVVDDESDWWQLGRLLDSALSTVGADDESSLSDLAVGDLFALANAIAAMVGGATTIENLQEQVLAYSTLPGQLIDEDRREGILGRQVPDLPENAEQYASVFQATGAVRLPAAAPALSRLAVAVRAGSQILGSIWIVDASKDLDADAERALEGAAEIAALHMLRARSAADLVRQQRGELLRRLLEGGDDVHLVAEELNLDASDSFMVMAFRPEVVVAIDALPMSRLVDLIATQCEAYRHGTQCVVIGTTVYALLAGDSTLDPSAIGELGRRLVTRAATALHLAIRAALGSRVHTIGRISKSRHDADLVLLLMTHRPTLTSVASAEDVRSQLTLLELAHVIRDSPSLLSPAAKSVLELDASSGSDYAKTLRTYLDCSRDSARTATRLSLHQNTLRYRLRRISELLGIDLDNPDDTLVLWLGLRVAEFD